MFKATAKLFIALLLSGLLISSNALAFHKINFEETTVYEDVDLEREQVKQKYCALKVKKKTNKGSTEQATNDEGKVGWLVTGSHYLIKISAGKKLLIGTQKKQPLKKKIDHETSLEDVFKYIVYSMKRKIDLQNTVNLQWKNYFCKLQKKIIYWVKMEHLA